MSTEKIQLKSALKNAKKRPGEELELPEAKRRSGTDNGTSPTVKQVTWREDVEVTQISRELIGLAKEGNFKDYTIKLKALSKEDKNKVVKYDEGIVIKALVKGAYMAAKKNKYNKESFQKAYYEALEADHSFGINACWIERLEIFNSCGRKTDKFLKIIGTDSQKIALEIIAKHYPPSSQIISIENGDISSESQVQKSKKPKEQEKNITL